jgi:hypothetical protein
LEKSPSLQPSLYGRSYSVDGLLLRLLDDKRDSAGQWFWPCFEPLRSVFERYFWILHNQPWMGAPIAFDHERESVHYEGIGEASVWLWRPSAVGRWADRFGEEQIELWAVNPTDDPARLASEFSRTFGNREDAFIEKHAEVWLIYTDGTCWEIFAKQPHLLQAVRDHLQGNETMRVYESNSQRRGRAYSKAGLGEI